MANVLVISHEATILETRRDLDSRIMGDKTSNIPADTLQKSFQNLVAVLSSSLTLPTTIGAFEVDSLDVELELTAEGQIGLLGNGGKVGGKGSLTLRLKRPENASGKNAARASAKAK
ncbi:hypothetical protein QA645_32355 [Bradyrhizobium sp. CIAT3101]|uniref:Pepco domain-containing protein n=1 Tax=Bradyrhizobium sp. CIAT3101 TaxID=439387 RepID=UPI0024B1D148|nr:hypothetical protein [Bradyrhizobium sp. CIAT3101]WFU79187.1 hypothetical protein QA645_32355 [Bradyrhizobium sp. CIAT3101]